jgi:hypothetical protein
MIQKLKGGEKSADQIEKGNDPKKPAQKLENKHAIS